ncbi:hypothetical protein BHE90_000976 [Fusarium euwallaceae]|nr:hypothetical protein BHE90_000976 [Fusarium euwallaceae]
MPPHTTQTHMQRCLHGSSVRRWAIPIPPQWSLTPYCNDYADLPRPDIVPWSRRADLVKASPDVVSPLDLLFGSKHNSFATSIQRTLRQFHCRDPERLAIGWLLFMRLLEYMRPVVEQLQVPHPSYLDMILWKRLRVNLLRTHQTLDLDKVLGLLSCCLKVRWPWGEDILEPGNDGELHIRPQFFEVFTQVEGWGLTSD